MINDNMTFEEALSALEKAASALRGDNISLEEAMKIFEDGTVLYEKCRQILDEAKQKNRDIFKGVKL